MQHKLLYSLVGARSLQSGSGYDTTACRQLAIELVTHDEATVPKHENHECTVRPRSIDLFVLVTGTETRDHMTMASRELLQVN